MFEGINFVESHLIQYVLDKKGRLVPIKSRTQAYGTTQLTKKNATRDVAMWTNDTIEYGKVIKFKCVKLATSVKPLNVSDPVRIFYPFIVNSFSNFVTIPTGALNKG